jgi:phosphoribosylglycinamide formyltransferase-1
VPPIVVLISGRGSNMLALLEAGRQRGAAFALSQVLSDQPGAPGLAAATAGGVAAQGIAHEPGETRSAYDDRLIQAIDRSAPVLVVLAGFMRILSPGFVRHYAGRLLNIHPSLLPKYPGLHTHRRALEAGDAEHGATVHFVTEELDAGPRVLQVRVPVNPGDTQDTLGARLLAREHLIYPLAVRWFCEGRLRCWEQLAWLDGRPLHEPVQYDEQQHDAQRAAS